ncbi:MAG: Lrp/AsnC family transcriptional regulator [Candidatus Kariarchaeaceae archaeon]|jgi:Lrp/AsnC family leucine-responsive transcriptional regulator
MSKLDDLDLQILQLLRQDGRMSIKELADNLGRRRATIHARMEKLRDSGVFKGFSVVPDFKQLGTGITVFLLASELQSSYEGAESLDILSQKLTKIPYVTEVHSISGEWDYLLKARVPDLESIGTAIIFELRKNFGISRTLTLAVFQTEMEELGNVQFNFLTNPYET